MSDRIAFGVLIGLVGSMLVAPTATSLAQGISMSGGPGEPNDGIPREYVVREGDTLWGICQNYFGDPYRWPNVWALNPHITNPHWIYPGDVIRLRMPDQIAGLPPGAVPGLQPVTYTVGTAAASQVSLNEGFISEEPMEPLGTLRWSRSTVRFLSVGDPVYVDFDDLSEVRIGQRYTVYSVLNDIYHPTTEAFLGQKVQVLGIVEIDRVDVNMATGRLVASFREIERGAEVTKLMDHYYVVSPRQNLIDLEGTVVDVMREIAEIGQFHLVYVDKGTKDGVLVGNRFHVLRRGDGFLELADEAVKKFPWEQVGELLVVATQDRNSTAIVTRSLLELAVGDRVAMRRNY